METTDAPHAPPFCPNPICRFHRADRAGWTWKRAGFYPRARDPYRIQRFQCCHCRRHFSTQTFSTTYWLKRPEVLAPLFMRSVACSGLRQIAREFGASPSTIQGQLSRLGRHCLLFERTHGPCGPVREPLVLDGFQSFEYSQDHPYYLNCVVGKASQYFYAFTESEMRRSGSMTAAQRRRRSEVERRHGRPDPRAIEVGTAEVLQLVAPQAQSIVLHSDDHRSYPRAIRRLAHLDVTHSITSSRAARIPQNPLFAINSLDHLVRHSGAHHKRETIAFSKRRQGGLERSAIFQVWRNHMKWSSERRRGATPAMRLGLADRRKTVAEVLSIRLFVSRIRLPEVLSRFYWREVETRRIAQNRRHTLRLAY